MWICPKCSRTFRTLHQAHSCNVSDLEEHFQKKPEFLREIFNLLLDEVDHIGETSLSIVRSAIFLKKQSTYLEIKVRKDHLLVGFYLARELSGLPIVKTLKISKNRIVHVVNLYNPKDVDEQLKGWLRESYSLIK